MSENNYIGTIEEQALMCLKGELYTISGVLREDIKNPSIDNKTFVKLYEKFESIQRSIFDLTAIVNKQKGIGYINKFGTDSYSQEHLDYMNSLYDSLNGVKNITK